MKPSITTTKSLMTIALGAIGDGMLTVALWGKNLLDDDYPNYSINFGALNFITEQYGDPATYGVDFTYEF